MNAALFLTALFNGGWQGLLLCALAYGAFRCARSLNATTMFTVWNVLLVICIALPFANYAFAARPYTEHVIAAPVRTLPVVAPVHFAERRDVEEAPAPNVRERAIAAITLLMNNARMLLALLGALAAFRLALLVRDLGGMFDARRNAKPIASPVEATLKIERPYAFASSDSLKSPCVLGFVPALIVIPDDLLSAPQNELLSVVLHEAEHVRRYDDVQNVLHRAIWAVAFFCPGIRIALRELALYREQICDDAAVNALGDPLAYARTLTGMAQWAQGRGVPVPSLIFKRKQLLHRLEVLLDRAVNHSLRMNRRFAVSAALALVLAAAIVLRVQVPVVAQVLVAPVPPPSLHSVVHVRRVVKPHARPPQHAGTAVAKPVVAKRPPQAPKALGNLPKVPAAPHTHVHVHARVNTRWLPTAPVGLSTVSVSRSSYSYAVGRAAYAVGRIPTVAIVKHIGTIHGNGSEALLGALQDAGLTNLPVDDLIALRDHGVSPQLIEAAHQYFGSSLTARCLVHLADHGVDAVYLAGLRNAGATGVSADDVVRLRDRGVDGLYIERIRRYNPRATVDDIIKLHDSGF